MQFCPKLHKKCVIQYILKQLYYGRRFCRLSAVKGTMILHTYCKIDLHANTVSLNNSYLTVSNTFNIKSEFTACARKQKPYAFANKTK